MNMTASRIRLVAACAALTGGALLASTAWTSSETPDTRDFICDNGDRFAVEFMPDHVRLRHGSGVFALAAVKPEHTWSDGRMVLQAGASNAIISFPGYEQAQSCVIAPA